MKLGRILPHGGRYHSCIIGLWFHDGIYKVCSTWQVTSTAELIPGIWGGGAVERVITAMIYIRGISVNAFLGFLIEKYCVDPALKWQFIVFSPFPRSRSIVISSEFSVVV